MSFVSFGGIAVRTMSARVVCGAIACVAAITAGALAPSAWATPTITVPVVTSTLSNFGAHRATTITAHCSSGLLMGGGSYLRNASNPATVPNNGLVLDGTLPSDSSGGILGAMSLTSPTYWTTVAGFSGQSEAGDQAAAFGMCASSNGPSGTVVVKADTTAANTTQQTSLPTLTVATCPTGDQLLGGGTVENTPGQVNDASTMANGGNLKPMASYPSYSDGSMPANNATDADSWSAYGSAGMPVSTDDIFAFAVCSTDNTTPAVTVVRDDDAGPNAQTGTTVTSDTVHCSSGRLISGGFAVDETVSGIGSGLQPQQGYHMRGSYPSDSGGSEVANNATNPSYWTIVQQAGGQNLSSGSNMVTHAFALCSA